MHSALEWLPGYLGNSVAQRQQIEAQYASKKDTLSGAKTRIPEHELLFEDELQTVIDYKLNEMYNDYRAHAPHVPTPQQLIQIRAFMGKQHHRTIRAFGVEFNGQTYTSAQIWDTCAIGDGVLVVENIDNPQEVNLYTPLGKFICTARSTQLNAECMDLESFKRAKKTYIEGQINPFLEAVKHARDKVAAHRKANVANILAKSPPKGKAAQAPTPQKRSMNTLEALRRLRKAAGYD